MKPKAWSNGLFSLWDAPAGNHGSYIHQSKLPVQDDEYKYYDSLQAHLIEGISIVNSSSVPFLCMESGAWNLLLQHTLWAATSPASTKE